MLKAVYKKVVTIENQMRINNFLRVTILGDVGYLRLQKMMNAGALSSKVTDTGTLFFHIPKSAGTSIVRALYGNSGVGHFPAHVLKKADEQYFFQAYKFTVVRDPYDRLISAYEFAKRGGTDDVPFFAGYDMGEFPQNFDMFVVEWLARIDFDTCDYVFRPQNWFVCDQNQQLLIDKVYKFENMDQVEVELSNHTGRTIKIPMTNKVARNKAISDYYSNPTVLNLVNEIYKQDFEIFGYEMKS
ncbi:MAG: sulfotransferase family 2 domain-containing protein [Alteromonas sp.]|uniref:sulfotransferase family 2 domain-containing protein n=1 Tax=Alteromonas sp. TaxID=232 RepID=UPI0032D9167E